MAEREVVPFKCEEWDGEFADRAPIHWAHVVSTVLPVGGIRHEVPPVGE